MAASEGVLWALTLVIVLLGGAATWLVLRCAGTVGRVNKILGDVGKEVPPAAASVRQIFGNMEKVTANAAAFSETLKDIAAPLRLLAERFRAAVNFLDQNLFSQLAAFAPLIKLIGAVLGRLLGRSKEGTKSDVPEGAPRS